MDQNVVGDVHYARNGGALAQPHASREKPATDEACALERPRFAREARQKLRKATAAVGALEKRASALAKTLSAAVAAPAAPQPLVPWTELRATHAALEARAEAAREAPEI